jgi:non-heme chloroperoxidase
MGLGCRLHVFGVIARPMETTTHGHDQLKTYAGFPHGMPTTQADTINPDLLAFLRS